VSNLIQDDCIPSTSGRDEFSSTSPTCCKTQGNAKVSGDEHCNVDNEISLVNPSCVYHCNASSLDLNTSITIHACVDSPCISCVNCLNKSHDDMLALSCCHDKISFIFSSICVTNNVEKT
jgi:hypothetical protein